MKMENRSSQKIPWNLHCLDYQKKGFLLPFEILHWKHRTANSEDCFLSLLEQKIKIVLGQKWFVDQGKLYMQTVREIHFPALPKTGSLQLFQTPDSKRQWVKDAVASSEYSSASWSAKQLIGPASITTCGDLSQAWASKESDKGEEWVRIFFEKKVKAQGILVHLNYNPGAIREIRAKINGTWIPVWSGNDPSLGKCPSIAGFAFQETVETQEIKIVLDTKRVIGWNEIDAVQLIEK